MKAWKMNALVAAIALCAAGAGAQTNPMAPSTGAGVNSNMGNKDAQAECANLTGQARSDCLRNNLNRGSNADCGSLAGTARADCIANNSKINPAIKTGGASQSGTTSSTTGTTGATGTTSGTSAVTSGTSGTTAGNASTGAPK